MSGMYNYAKKCFFDGSLSWTDSGTTFKAMPMKSTYVFDPDTTTVDAISSYEVSGTGYTAGPAGSRVTVGTRTSTADNTNDVATADAADITFPSVQFTTNTAGVLIYKHVSSSDDTLNIPICFVSFTSVATNGSNFQVSWNSAGIFEG